MESLLSYLIAASVVILGIWLYVDDYRAAKRRRETLSAFITGSATVGFSAADFTGGCDGGGGGDGGGGSC